MKQFFRIILAIVLFTGPYFTLLAIPAYPYPIKITQPDGSELTIMLKGDEFYRYKTTLDGILLVEDANGIHKYARLTDDGRRVSTGVKAQEIQRRTNAEKKLVRELQSSTIQKKIDGIQKAARVTAAEKAVLADNGFPLTGSPRSLVILVNFSDKNYVVSNPQTAFTNLLNQEGYSANGGTGSARDYFRDASNGIFAPQFDVVGPYTLPQNMEYYGGNDNSDNDKNPRQMVIDACSLADQAGLDFTTYDTDNNGIIDNVFIYYAGYNEAEGGGDNTVWPHRWSMPSNSNYRFDGVKLWDYACTSELRGSTGSNMCGIGTFCHEFGHVLGLPDYYHTAEDKNTLGNWSIMDGGAYLNQGRTPPTYSAYDRFYLDWLKPVELKVAQNVTLEPLLSSKQAYIITKDGNHNMIGNDPQPREFFVLENRQKTGWDAYLPASGMLIWHIDYLKSGWDNNSPNNYTGSSQTPTNHMRVYLQPLIGQTTTPGTAFKSGSFTPTLWNGTNINKPLTFIKESQDGLITFRFMGGGKVPLVNAKSSMQLFSTVHGTASEIQTLKVYGSTLKDSVRLNFSQKQHFEMRMSGSNDWKKQLTLAIVDSMLDTTIIEIRYNPAEPSFKYSHDESVNISSTDAESVKLVLSGISTRPVYVVTPVANEAIDVQENSFVANWNNVYDASGFYLTVYTENDTIANEKWIVGNKNLSVVSDTIRLLIPAKSYYYKVKASDKTLYLDKTLKYENTTDFSNTVEITTKTETDAQKLKTVVVKSDNSATITVIMPEKNQILYIYNTAGMLIRKLQVPENKIDIKLENLPTGTVYILKSGNRRAKLIL
ncbi:MAG: M6 family metalloprotease domain-containing protein [Bacteroidia bacterium]|nr:M6 family metalloprotease domain-containing protein [Bacteroidia bacterium]